MSAEANAWGVTQGAHLTCQAKFVFMRFCDYANAETQEAWPSLETIARETNLDRGSVYRIVQRLLADGLLRVAKVHAGRPTRYLVPHPARSMPPLRRSPHPEDVEDVHSPARDARGQQSFEDLNPARGARPDPARTPRVPRANPARGARQSEQNRDEPIAGASARAHLHVVPSEPAEPVDPDAWHRIPDETRELAAKRIAELRAQMGRSTASEGAGAP